MWILLGLHSPGNSGKEVFDRSLGGKIGCLQCSNDGTALEVHSFEFLLTSSLWLHLTTSGAAD